MLRAALVQASRLCESLVLEALSLQHAAALPRHAGAQTLVTLRRFTSEEPPAASPAQPGSGAAGGQGSPRGVQQWRQWVDAKIGEKLDGRSEERAEEPAAAAPAAAPEPAAAATAAAEPTAGVSAAAPGPALAAAPSGPAAVEAELRDLLHPESRKSQLSVEQQIFKIVVPASGAAAAEGEGAPANYKQLGQAKEAPRLFPGGANKADEISPERVHPYRLFYPGQLYAPQDLDPYQAKETDAFTAGKTMDKYISRAEVEALADFRNPQFLTSFVSDAGKLVPRRRTRLQQKLHRHLCRQIKVARIMAILPPDSRLPQYTVRRRAPRSPPQPQQPQQPRPAAA